MRFVGTNPPAPPNARQAAGWETRARLMPGCVRRALNRARRGATTGGNGAGWRVGEQVRSGHRELIALIAQTSQQGNRWARLRASPPLADAIRRA